MRPDIGLVTVVGPPWLDEYTGLQLDDKKTEIAMQSERASLDRFTPWTTTWRRTSETRGSSR